MAQKRMFSKDVTNSDIFLDMPLSSQCLYFHLWMNADDDWFVQPRSIVRLIQAKDDDLKILVAKWFCIVFADSVVVITHRKQNNQIQKDRYKATVYQEHLKVLWLLPNKEYKLLDTKWIQNVYNMDTQISLEENSLDKISQEEINLEETTPVGVPEKKKSIINKNNKPWAIQIYDKIKEMCIVVDGTLSDCVVLRSRLEQYGGDPVKLLEIMITKMRDTGLSQYYSISNPWKLADNVGTIVEKLKAEKPKQNNTFISWF